jgi:hypothetical protein
MRKLLAVLAVAAALPIAVAGAAVGVTVVVDYDPALGELPGDKEPSLIWQHRRSRAPTCAHRASVVT